ncbi:hypothetical protein B0H14DRAFT_2639896 [Mycena olivaceomarginata]|nr:hypothetical protein B0H14DRAFT_2639896 [Mycena olivaceomarginata]
MGDTLCSGLLYLCSCCCFCSSSDPGSDGSGFCSGSGSSRNRKRDPREKALEQEFMERGYRKDATSGRIHVDQPSQSHLMMAAIGKQPSAQSVEHPSRDSTTQPNKDPVLSTGSTPFGDPP